MFIVILVIFRKLRYGGIFSNHFIYKFSAKNACEKNLKIG